MNVGGNTTATIQVKTNVKNEFGERVSVWTDVKTVKGWLDLSNGTSDYLNYNAKIQDSTHYFLCDVFDLTDVTKDNARMIINGKPYAILLIDDPMEMHQHYEIYLKYLEGGV